MRKLALNDVLRRIVGVALASSVGAAGYACGGQEQVAVPSPDYDPGRALVDGADPAFADEGTFACELPLPSVLDQLTPLTPVDYVELRNQGWALAPPRPQGAAMASVASGTPCATAVNHDACLGALAALTPTSEPDGWLAGDPVGPRAEAEVLQILVYSRGDEVGALRNAGEVAAFLGTIDTLEEARLVLQAQGARLACSLDVPKSGYRRNSDGSWELLIVGSGSCGTYSRNRYVVAQDGTTTLVAMDKSLLKTTCSP